MYIHTVYMDHLYSVKGGEYGGCGGERKDCKPSRGGYVCRRSHTVWEVRRKL